MLYNNSSKVDKYELNIYNIANMFCRRSWKSPAVVLACQSHCFVKLLLDQRRLYEKAVWVSLYFQAQLAL